MGSKLLKVAIRENRLGRHLAGLRSGQVNKIATWPNPNFERTETNRVGPILTRFFRANKLTVQPDPNFGWIGLKFPPLLTANFM